MAGCDGAKSSASMEEEVIRLMPASHTLYTHALFIPPACLPTWITTALLCLISESLASTKPTFFSGGVFHWDFNLSVHGSMVEPILTYCTTHQIFFFSFENPGSLRNRLTGAFQDKPILIA
jgi:hypothetical protein